LSSSDDVVAARDRLDGIEESGFVCKFGHGYIIPKVQALVNSLGRHNFYFFRVVLTLSGSDRVGLTLC
jgi:hypothetical protein